MQKDQKKVQKKNFGFVAAWRMSLLTTHTRSVISALGSSTVWGTTSIWTCLPPSSWEPCPFWWKTLCWPSHWTLRAAGTARHTPGSTYRWEKCCLCKQKHIGLSYKQIHSYTYIHTYIHFLLIVQHSHRIYSVIGRWLGIDWVCLDTLKGAIKVKTVYWLFRQSLWCHRSQTIEYFSFV